MKQHSHKQWRVGIFCVGCEGNRFHWVKTPFFENWFLGMGWEEILEALFFFSFERIILEKKKDFLKNDEFFFWRKSLTAAKKAKVPLIYVCTVCTYIR